MDSEKVKAELDEIVEQCRGMDYIGFSTITEHCQNILALLKEQEDLGTELMNAVELIHKKNERIEKLLKEKEAVEPRVSTAEQRCGHCNKVIEMDGWQSCPWCGKRIDWKGWWKKNGTRNQDS